MSCTKDAHEQRDSVRIVLPARIGSHTAPRRYLIIKYQARRWNSARTAAPEKKAASVKRQASVTVTR
ncbi:MAG: hypothetical protein WAU04_04265 [Candidatus Nitrotoga sp.]